VGRPPSVALSASGRIQPSWPRADSRIFRSRPRDRVKRVKPGRVPIGTGTAPVPGALDQAALTSIVLGIAACGVGTLTWSMPFAYFASTWAASTPSGSAKLRWNAPYATSRTK